MSRHEKALAAVRARLARHGGDFHDVDSLLAEMPDLAGTPRDQLEQMVSESNEQRRMLSTRNEAERLQRQAADARSAAERDRRNADEARRNADEARRNAEDARRNGYAVPLRVPDYHITPVLLNPLDALPGTWLERAERREALRQLERMDELSRKLKNDMDVFRTEPEAAKPKKAPRAKTPPRKASRSKSPTNKKKKKAAAKK